MMMKKVSATAIVVISLFAFAACNTNKEKAPQDIEVQQTDTILATETTESNTDTAISTVKEIISQKSDAFQDAAHDTKEGVKVVTDNAKEKIKETSNQVMNETKEIVHKTVDKTRDLTHEAEKNIVDTKQKIEDRL